VGVHPNAPVPTVVAAAAVARPFPAPALPFPAANASALKRAVYRARVQPLRKCRARASSSAGVASTEGQALDKLVPFSAQLDCLLVAYLCARKHSPLPPPWRAGGRRQAAAPPGRHHRRRQSFPDCLLRVKSVPVSTSVHSTPRPFPHRDVLPRPPRGRPVLRDDVLAHHGAVLHLRECWAFAFRSPVLREYAARRRVECCVVPRSACVAGAIRLSDRRHLSLGS